MIKTTNSSSGATSRPSTQKRTNTYKTPQKQTHPSKKYVMKTPAVEKDVIRIIPLGGVEEVGKNMLVLEFNDDILIFDCGFQFVSEEDAPGIDYIIPNVKYLQENKHKIKALIVTHGHLDHIAAIPYIMDKIGNPPIYARNLTNIMIKKRMEEFPRVAMPNLKDVKPRERIRLGNLSLKFIDVTHSIPDSMGISIETPFGNVVITGDLKLEHVDGIPTEKEERNWGDIGKENNILLIADSTNVEKPGFSIPESNILDNIEEIIKKVDGRVIIGTFASQFERMVKIINIAEKYNKKVVTEGRSIKTNIEIAKLAGLLNPRKETLIAPQDIINYQVSDVHSTGHGNAGELAWINKMVNAKYFMPAYGHHSMLKIHAEVAKSVGMKDENIIVPDDGSIVEIQDGGKKIVVRKEKAPSSIMMVDGFSVGDIQEVVIRDRQTLAQDGIFVAIATVDVNTGKLRKSPDIISRGFVYLRESQELLQQTRKIIKKTVEDGAEGMRPINFETIKKEVTDNVGRFLLKKTDKRPIIIPVILGV